MLRLIFLKFNLISSLVVLYSLYFFTPFYINYFVCVSVFAEGVTGIVKFFFYKLDIHLNNFILFYVTKGKLYKNSHILVCLGTKYSLNVAWKMFMQKCRISLVLLCFFLLLFLEEKVNLSLFSRALNYSYYFISSHMFNFFLFFFCFSFFQKAKT